MRRKDREITEFDELVAVMRRCDVCRLGLNQDGYPYLLPLNFGLYVRPDKTVELYFHSAMQGTKLNLIAKDNRAAFEMDCAHRLVLDTADHECTMEYESVIGHGVIEMVSDEDKYEALCRIMRHYHAEEFPFNPKPIPYTAVYKLVVQEMTGKRRKPKQ